MKVPIDDIDLEYDEEWSFKNFTNQDLSDRALSGKVIYSTVFYNEKPNSEIFPPGMKGVIFIKCNMDNLVIPEGNTLIECTQRKFEAQEDGKDWLLDEDGNPLKLMGEK